MRKVIFYVTMAMLLLVFFSVIFFGYFAYRAYKNPFVKPNIRYVGGYQFEGDKEIGYVSVANASITEVSENSVYHIYTDKRRARVSREGYQTPDRAGIMTLGCSFAYGYRVENERTFTERLGKGIGLSVANFALPSYGTLQSLQILRRNLDLRPKVVIYAFITEHIRRNLSPCAADTSGFSRVVSFIDFDKDKGPYIHAPKFELFDPDLHMRFLEEITFGNKGFGLKDILWRIRIDLHRLREWKDVGYPNDAVSRKVSLSYLINEMDHFTRAMGAKLVIVYLPFFGKGYIEPPPEELLTSLNDDILFIDVSPSVLEYYKKEDNTPLTLPGDYSHPGELGHALIAQELERAIREEQLLE